MPPSSSCAPTSEQSLYHRTGERHPRQSPEGDPLATPAPDFAHESERQFVQLLDFYGIEWEYEPRTFELAWDDDGNPVEAFSPDFYLPAYDLFIELTTLSQKLVTRKNRKVRRLRELHPEVRIKILYQRDYHSLLVKYDLAG